ncbi:MAG TPA: efflux RND transporter periplasmic adaptor subunit [Thermoanaerobaculia bacterium]|nr:efflux RND transporter periplasmic adaptor subunit [Thermoanaerobaculia bacterium]
MSDDHEPRPNLQPSEEPGRAPRYRAAFFVALALAATFALAAAALWWRLHQRSVPGARAAAQAPAGGDLKPPEAGRPGVSPPPGGGGSEMLAAKPQETPLAPIQLSPQRVQSIGVQTGSVAYKHVEDELRFAGSVQVDERRLAYVQTRFAGWIRRLYVATTGEFVRRGQPLFTIYSPDLVTTEQEYLLARKTQRALAGSSVDGVAAGASSLLSAAKARLQQWQVPAREIEKLEASGQAITDLPINSPASGYIMEKNILPNMYVQPDTKLYTVADLAAVWVVAQVFQNDAGRIKPGDPAEVTVDAYPGAVFRGAVDYLLPQVDAATRTLPVRLVFANPGLELRPGMYVNVRLHLPLGRQLVIPAAAAFQSGSRSLVFLYRGNGNIEPRQVELGPRVGDDLVVAKGLSAGDAIVTSANFLIDSEAQLQAAAGAFIPPPPGAGAASAINAPAQAQAAVEMTTDPSPPRKGSNSVRVRVTGADGKPLAGAEVSITFFMAAMPAMGMAAMNTTIKASDQGGGMYAGQGTLESGGTWQVTVTVRQQGRTLVAKHLTVNATGGM